MTLNARFILKCALRTARLWLSVSTIRTGIARGAEVEWAGGPSPPPCGQLTLCFSTVAELLVIVFISLILFVFIVCLRSVSLKFSLSATGVK